ncbi:MAG TPA: glycoside hydrolase family 3 N-terminal domain-containing protein, partial [Trebonia sp.]|nr:glycoside hydrolase family 3 N-terminal domain-containing protein [Trebonia sp.]
MHWDRARPRARTLVTCAVAVGAALAVTAGCSSAAAPAAPSASSLHPSAVTSSPSTASPSPASPSPSVSCAAQVFGRLTEAQRVGQLFLVGVTDDIAGPQTTAALQQYHFGSLLLYPTSEGVTALAAATAHMQALGTANDGGVRMFIAANQEGGEVQQLTGPGFSVMPSALTQGTWPTATLRSAAAGWARELRAAGVNFDLAPVMDVVPAATAASNAPIGALDRQFGSTPAGNGAHGAAFITGMASAGVATSAKHFPGLGRVTGNTDFTADVVDNVTTPDDPYLGSFRAAVVAGVPFVMVALATYTLIDRAQLAVFSPTVMKLVRSGSGLGFGGVIMSDD